MRQGIWVFNGTFRLVDAWQEQSAGRKVFKFRLEVDPTDTQDRTDPTQELEQTRVIPTAVKLAVWKRTVVGARDVAAPTTFTSTT
jgi:hypothetical protein